MLTGTELVGYLAAALIGISLGLIGAGGSILTVPLMIYLFRVPALIATSYSLFIVGCTSLVGALNKNNFRAGKISTALIFCLTSATVVSIIRKWIVPAIPDELFRINGTTLHYSTLTTIVFAAVMIIAARPLIGSTHQNDQQPKANSSMLRLAVCGVLVGVITGFLGAGGGFLIVPALVFMLGFDMKEAITTSLMIIAINSMVGFAADLGHMHIDWKLLGITTSAAIVGVFAGRAMAGKISPEKLKVLFGWFILIMGITMLIKESVVFFG